MVQIYSPLPGLTVLVQDLLNDSGLFSGTPYIDMPGLRLEKVL